MTAPELNYKNVWTPVEKFSYVFKVFKNGRFMWWSGPIVGLSDGDKTWIIENLKDNYRGYEIEYWGTLEDIRLRNQVLQRYGQDIADYQISID